MMMIMMICCCICTEAEGRRYDDDAHSSRSGIIKLGAIRDIIDRVSNTHIESISVQWQGEVWSKSYIFG